VVRDIPGGQLGPHIICGADETRFGQGTAEKGQLAKTYGANLAFNPSVLRRRGQLSGLGTRSDQSSLGVILVQGGDRSPGWGTGIEARLRSTS
jgi:hypothetical protein